MILSIVDLSATGAKRTEVYQTLASLAPVIRGEDGCLACDLSVGSQDETGFTIVEEWRSREEYDRHLRSRSFGVLLGLSPLLARPIGVRICTVVSREGMEAVRRARARALPH